MEPKNRVHVCYIIGILIAIIVLMATTKWTKIEGLLDYFSFALTFSSLILAILAIGYSVYSNAAISGSLGAIANAAGDVTKASKDIQTSHIELRTEVQKLPSRIDSVEQNILQAHAILKDWSSVTQQATIATPSEQPAPAEPSDETATRFLNQMSIAGMEALLAATLSKRTNTALAVTELVTAAYPEDARPGSADYMSGILVATACAGIVQYENDERHRFVFSFVHPIIEENVLQKVVERITIKAKESAKRPPVETEEAALARWMSAVRGIEKYFGVEAAT
jgi:hypothetical protein